MEEGANSVPFAAEFPLLWGDLPGLPEEVMCPLGNPVPTLPTLSHPGLGAGLSPPLDCEPGGREGGPGQGCLSYCCVPSAAQHRYWWVVELMHNKVVRPTSRLPPVPQPSHPYHCS